MKDSVVSPLLAEMIGTFGLIFMGCSAVVMTSQASGFSNLVAVALAHGFAILVGAAALGHISGGHFNPAVTVAMLVTKRIAPSMAALYIAAQLVGAALAGMFLVAINPASAIATTKLGATLLAPGVSPLQGFIIETVLTFFLVTVIFGTAVDSRGASGIAPIAIGFTIAMDIMAAGPVTGASMNPARSFGPAFALAGVPGIWADHLIYWLAPITGAIIAAVIYDRFMLGRR